MIGKVYKKRYFCMPTQARGLGLTFSIKKTVLSQQRKTFSEILTHGYLLALRDEVDFNERFTLRISVAKGLLALFILGAVCMGVAYFIVRAGTNTSGGFSSEDEKLLTLLNKVDSLEQHAEIQGKYQANLRQILKGETPEDQSPQAAKPLEGNPESYLEKAESVDPLDSQFRKSFESQDELMALSTPERSDDLKHMVFFTPLQGVVSQAFDVKKRHFGIDIVAKKNTPIKAVADGTVVLSSWTQDSGHVIGVQHKNQVLTFYKHNSVLLKKVGEYVQAGEAVAIIGNSGELTNGPHLHLEVWYNGNPVNPQDFIAF